MVDQIRIDRILQIPPPVVRQEDVDRLGAGVGAVGRDAVVDAVDDVGMWREEAVRLDLFEGLRHGFLPEGAADLLQRVEGLGGRVLDEVDVGEAALECALDGQIAIGMARGSGV